MKKPVLLKRYFRTSLSIMLVFIMMSNKEVDEGKSLAKNHSVDPCCIIDGVAYCPCPDIDPPLSENFVDGPKLLSR